jgi:hypothetical protein
LKGLAAVSTPPRHFQKDSRAIDLEGLYSTQVRGFRGRFRGDVARRPHPDRDRPVLAFGALPRELKSNKLSQRQTPDANNRAGKQEPAF